MSQSHQRAFGPKTAERLAAVGVTSLDEVKRLGSVEVYRRLKAAFPREVSLNALWSLEGALLEIRWDQLLDELKADLLRELNDG